MTIQMDKDIRYVFDALPSFGRHSSAVMGYACLFGVTPFSIKAAKLRKIIEEMKRLFDSQSFNYQKRLYEISHAGIAEALDICLKKNFSQHLENHNYLKRVMMDISQRETQARSRQSEKDLRKREDQSRAGYDRPVDDDKTCNCRYSDAWKCAKDQLLPGQVACDCACHKPPFTQPSPSMVGITSGDKVSSALSPDKPFSRITAEDLPSDVRQGIESMKQKLGI